MIYYHAHGLYASSLLAFPFRSVALPLYVCRNLAIDYNDDDNYDNVDDLSAYVVASPTSRSALVFTMPTRPCMHATPFSCCLKI